MTSELQPEHALKGAYACLCGDVTEGRAAVDIQRWICRLRLVEDVGRVHPEFDRLGFVYFEAFAEAAVKRPGAGKFVLVLAEIASYPGVRVLQYVGAELVRNSSER